MELCDAAGVNCENEALYGGTCSKHVGLPLRKVRTEVDVLRAQLKIATGALENIKRASYCTAKAPESLHRTPCVYHFAAEALRAIKGEGEGKT